MCYPVFTETTKHVTQYNKARRCGYKRPNAIQNYGDGTYNHIGLYCCGGYNNPCNHSTISEDAIPETNPPIIP